MEKNINLNNISYNYNFDVKYFNIQKELLEKIKNEKLNNNYLEYNEEDVYLIIDKLYIDEIISVFNLDDINDKKIYKIIEHLFIIFIENKNNNIKIEKFKNIFFEKNFIIYNNILLKEKEINNLNKDFFKNLNLLYFYNLFNFNYFHIFHKIIKDYLINNTIDDNLLEIFKEIKDN